MGLPLQVDARRVELCTQGRHGLGCSAVALWCVLWCPKAADTGGSGGLGEELLTAAIQLCGVGSEFRRPAAGRRRPAAGPDTSGRPPRGFPGVRCHICGRQSAGAPLCQLPLAAGINAGACCHLRTAAHSPRWIPAFYRLPGAHPATGWPSCSVIGGLASMPTPLSRIAWSTCSIYSLSVSLAVQHPESDLPAGRCPSGLVGWPGASWPTRVASLASPGSAQP